MFCEPPARLRTRERSSSRACSKDLVVGANRGRPSVAAACLARDNLCSTETLATDRHRELELRRSGGTYRWRNRRSGTSACTTPSAGSRRAPAPHKVVPGSPQTSRPDTAPRVRRDDQARGGGRRHVHARGASHSSHLPSLLLPRLKLRRAAGLSKLRRRGAWQKRYQLF